MKTRKKILYGITKSNWGGAQSYVYDLAVTLPEADYEVAVILGGEGDLKQRLEAKNLRTISLATLTRDIFVWTDIGNLLQLVKILKVEQPDVFHLNSSKMGLLGSLAGRICGVPKIIFTAHGWAFNEDRPAWQKFFIRLAQKLTVTLAHTTIAVSAMTKSQIDSNKSIVIYNGLGPIDFINTDEARKKITALITHKIEEGKLWLGTISELHKNKGLEYLIQAIHLLRLESDRVPNVFIIGDGEERDRLQKQIDSYHLQDKIFLVGKITDAAKYLSAFDLFTLTSITEALPYAVLEAGLAGLPIIASTVGGVPEIVEDGISGTLVPPKNARAIMQALLTLVDDQARREQFSLQIKAKIEKNFTKDKMVKETVALYN